MPPAPSSHAEALDYLTTSLSALNSSDANLGIEASKSKISSVSKFIDVLDEIEYSDDVATYLRKYGRVLVIQETDIQALFDDQQGKGYRVAASTNAGLHPSHLNYIKRVHVLIDSIEGCYFANHLGDNYHYQISRDSVSEFLFDAYKHGRKIKVAGINCGTSNCSGSVPVVNVPAPTDGEPDVVVYTSFTPIVASMGSGRVLVEDKSKTADENNTKYKSVTAPSMIVCMDLNCTSKKLQTKDLCDYLHKKDNGADNFGAFERNQYNTISFGFNTLDWSDTSREELYNLPTPSLTRRYDKFTGLGGDATMTITLSNLAAALTAIMDDVFDQVNLDKVFNDPKRFELFARKIHSSNRFEKITISVSRPSELLCSHVDSHNSDNLGYSGNFSFFSYHTSEGNNDPSKPGFLRRIHVGGYGRKSCDSILKRSTNVGDLIQRVHEEIAATPHHRISLDPDEILIPLENDHEILSTNKSTMGSPSVVDDMTARAPHLNKHIFYTFYVNVFSDWIKQRRVANDPVNWIELLQAVFSAVRWTSSPSNFAVIFRQVTDCRRLLSVKIPKGVIWDNSILNVLEKKEKKVPCTSLPLWLSFIFHIFDESGGVNRGRFPRFQQFAHHDIDIAIVEKSVQRFISLVNDLRSATSMSCDVDSPENRNKRHINAVKVFVKSIARSSNSGGVFGLGELLAYHVIGIFIYRGMASPKLN